MARPRAVVEAYWQAECKRDVQAVLGYYRSDAQLVVPGMGLLVGHEDIRRFYQASVDRFPILRVEITDAVEDGTLGAFEWSSVFLDEKEEEYRLTGVNVVHVEGKRFASVHVYYDPVSLEERTIRSDTGGIGTIGSDRSAR
ncbi:MAG: nuclear transport factor 2 family protein [Acidimicrobiales bacterium]